MKTLGQLCCQFRTDVLKLSLRQLGVGNFETVYAFEQSRSSNYRHINVYLNRATPEQFDLFVAMLANHIHTNKGI